MKKMTDSLKKNPITALKTEHKLYEQIWIEIEEEKTDLGLWAKCFAACDGNENKTKALYVDKRARILKEDFKKQTITQEIEAKKRTGKRNSTKKCPYCNLLNSVADTRCDCGNKFIKNSEQTESSEQIKSTVDEFKKTLSERPFYYPHLLETFGYTLQDRGNSWEIKDLSKGTLMWFYSYEDLLKAILEIIPQDTAQTIKPVQTIQETFADLKKETTEKLREIEQKSFGNQNFLIDRKNS